MRHKILVITAVAAVSLLAGCGPNEGGSSVPVDSSSVESSVESTVESTTESTVESTASDTDSETSSSSEESSSVESEPEETSTSEPEPVQSSSTPTQPTTPEQPSNPTTPTQPTTPEQPTTPTTPTQPTTPQPIDENHDIYGYEMTGGWVTTPGGTYWKEGSGFYRSREDAQYDRNAVPQGEVDGVKSEDYDINWD